MGLEMTLRLTLGLIFLTGAAAPTWAGEMPRYEAAPEWVLPAPTIKPAVTGAPLFAVLDAQTRIADGVVWSYHEFGARAVSGTVVGHMSPLTLSWRPARGDLIIHRVEILRDGQRIDVLKDGPKFTVAGRNQGPEGLETDEVMTATLQVDGVRMGDVLDLAYSVSAKDPDLKGGVQTSMLALSAPLQADFARARMLWPIGAPIRWKAYPVGIIASQSDRAGWRELSFVLPAPKQAELPADAPKRLQAIPAIEASSFRDWAAVSAVFTPFYHTQGLIPDGSPLAQEAVRIRSAETDPKRRAAAALLLVQDRIQNDSAGMDDGGYAPQSPTSTWSAGHGDCRAKTLLLLALLRELGIDAEPVLANIDQGDLLETRLPAPAALNHIFVHAKIGSQDLWLDGARHGVRLEDMNDPPPFHSVLPVRAKGATLLQLPHKAPERPTRTVLIDIDESAAIGVLAPFWAPFSATIKLRGNEAEALRSRAAHLSDANLREIALTSLAGAVGPDAITATQNVDLDASDGSTTITVTGIAGIAWKRRDHAYSLDLPSGVAKLTLDSDRSRPAWKDIPIATGAPDHTLVTTRLHLPDGGRGIALAGDAAVDLKVGGRRHTRTASLNGDLLKVEERDTNTGEELSPADLPVARLKLAAAQEGVLRLATRPGYPPPYQQAAAALRDHRLDKLAALYTEYIAARPSEPFRRLRRAFFYMSSFQWSLALADLDKTIASKGSAASYRARARVLEAMGDKEKAASDYRAWLTIDPFSRPALTGLGLLEIDAGRKESALALVEARLAKAGKDKPDWLEVKAQLLARAGDTDGALAAIDSAIALKPANSAFLSERCWIKGTSGVQLDGALQDCARALQLNKSNAATLDSRAMVYFRLNRLGEALADLDAALDRDPAAASSLYLRAAIERKLGKTQRADEDVAYAWLISPRIDDDYERWKIRA